jgi:hypothetical protein
LLVYEYNPLRNYRLNEVRFHYDNRFYTSSELLNTHNIISNIICITSNPNHHIIARYSGDSIVDKGVRKLKYLFTTFDLKT